MLMPATLDGALEGAERVLMISSADERLVDTQCTFMTPPNEPVYVTSSSSPWMFGPDDKKGYTSCW
jgi:hypothetical protein